MQNADRPVTIITGGTRGIGAATAIRLALAGHDLTLAYRQDDSAAQQTAARVRDAGARCVLVKADVTRHSDIERLFSLTADRLDGYQAIPQTEAKRSCRCSAGAPRTPPPNGGGTIGDRPEQH